MYMYRLFPKSQGGEVGLLLIRSNVLGNESFENRNRILSYNMIIRDSRTFYS